MSDKDFVSITYTSIIVLRQTVSNIDKVKSLIIPEVDPETFSHVRWSLAITNDFSKSSKLDVVEFLDTLLLKPKSERGKFKNVRESTMGRCKCLSRLNFFQEEQQGVINVGFSEYLTRFCFLETPVLRFVLLPYYPRFQKFVNLNEIVMLSLKFVFFNANASL